jgi:hypothetical protein
MKKIEKENFEKNAMKILQKYFKKYNIVVKKWRTTSSGCAYNSRLNANKQSEIEIPRPTDTDRLSVCFHEIKHIIDGRVKPRTISEFRCDKFALDKLVEYGYDTSDHCKRMKWHILHQVAKSTNRKAKNVPVIIRDFYSEINFDDWFGKKVWVGIRKIKGIGYSNVKKWDNIYMQISNDNWQTRKEYDL